MFVLSRNPAEPQSWPTCNYSIFRVTSKTHRQARDMAASRISKNGLEDFEQGGEPTEQCHWLNMAIGFPGSTFCGRCYTKTCHHFVDLSIVSRYLRLRFIMIIMAPGWNNTPIFYSHSSGCYYLLYADPNGRIVGICSADDLTYCSNENMLHKHCIHQWRSKTGTRLETNTSSWFRPI